MPCRASHVSTERISTRLDAGILNRRLWHSSSSMIPLAIDDRLLRIDGLVHDVIAASRRPDDPVAKRLDDLVLALIRSALHPMPSMVPQSMLWMMTS